MGCEEWKFVQMFCLKFMTMPIHGEKLQQSSSSEPRGWWPWNLVYSIGYSSTTNVFIWWPWVDCGHFYDRVKFVSECFCMGESLYSIECSCISKFVLIQHIPSTQVSDTGPMVLWLQISSQSFTNIQHKYVRTSHREVNTIWAMTWQNQQNECAPSEDSDQPGHQPGLLEILFL